MWNWASGHELCTPSPVLHRVLALGAHPDGVRVSHACVCPLCPQLRQLEMQLEQEYEEKQMALHEKQDLEGLIGTLCDQVRGSRSRQPGERSPCPGPVES